MDPSRPGYTPVRRRRENIVSSVQDIEAKIASELEGVLLASLRISQRRIVEMKEVAPLEKLLDAGLADHKKEITAHLETIRWDISSQDTLRAVTGGASIENVSFLRRECVSWCLNGKFPPYNSVFSSCRHL